MEIDEFTLASNLSEKGRHVEAYQKFLTLAEKGDSSAMSRIAVMHFLGEGVEQSIEKSIFWDKKSIGLGNLSAQLNLGITYKSIGNIEEANKLFRKSLCNGDGEGGVELIKIALHEAPVRECIVEIIESIGLSKGLTQSSREQVAVLADWFGIQN